MPLSRRTFFAAVAGLLGAAALPVASEAAPIQTAETTTVILNYQDADNYDAVEFISAPCAAGSCARAERRKAFWDRVERRPVRSAVKRLADRLTPRR